MIELRPYQQEAVAAIVDFCKNGDPKIHPIVVGPTGSGKSLLIAKATKELGDGVLVLNPSKELLEQNYAKFKMYGGEGSIYSASVGIKEIGQVTFATIGSIKNKPEDFNHVRYVLIDECHTLPPNSESMLTKFLTRLNNPKVVGLTATAFRLKNYRDPFTNQPYSRINLLPRERPRFFDTFIHVTQIEELYQQGFLCPIRYISLKWNKENLVLNSTGAEFTEDSVDKELIQQKVYERIPEIISQSIEKGRKHRLVFVKNVDVAQNFAAKLPHSACVHGATPKKEREDILNKFKSGEIKTVFNVGVLTTGFDFPELDTIIMAKPTMSLSLYYQIAGRGIRPHPNKIDCAFVDLCGNIDRFGKIEELVYENDLVDGWILKNKKKQLSGVRMNK